jgi:phosphomannomutase/phosphoglucomutase
LGAEVIELRCNFDGDFPPSGPDPSYQGNLDLLKQKVVEEKADLGFAYDGDGDRLAVVGKSGNSIETKIVFSLLTESIKRGSKVVHDILTSDTVVQVAFRHISINLLALTSYCHAFISPSATLFSNKLA